MTRDHLLIHEMVGEFQTCDAPCCLRPKSEGSAFGFQYFRGHMGLLALRPGDSLTILLDGFVNRLQDSQFPSCYSRYGAWALTPVGLAPTDHASLHWTHTLKYQCQHISSGHAERVSSERAKENASALHMNTDPPQHGPENMQVLRPPESNHDKEGENCSNRTCRHNQKIEAFLFWSKDICSDARGDQDEVCSGGDRSDD
jgi:hypothetical protein